MLGKNCAAVGRVHVFAHLGEAPYRFVGYAREVFVACQGAPVQPGGSCDHCGTAIMDVFRFVSADGRWFKVGSSCVEKAGDAGLRQQIDATVRKIKRERQVERDAVKALEARAMFAANKALFATKPHPRGYTDYETGAALTMADQIEWLLDHSGAKGIRETLAWMKRILEAEEKEIA